MIRLQQLKNRRKLFALAALTAISVLMVVFSSSVYVLNSPTVLRRVTAWWMGAQYLGTSGVVMQTQTNNCGPATLKMIFDHYGISSTIESMDSNAELTAKGTSMLTLKEMAEKRGLGAEGWRYTINDFMHAATPSIVFLHDDHFAVADSVTSDGYIILSDPALGRIKMSAHNFQKIWNGETLVFEGKDKN